MAGPGVNWKPGALKDFHTKLAAGGAKARDAAADLDKSVQRIFQITESQQGVINGTKSGSLIVTGTAAAVPTGLSVVNQVLCSPVGDLQTPLNFTAAGRPSPTVPGAIDISVSQPTSAVNTTPIISSTPLNVAWIAVGTG